jgi:hypothetical protein
MNEKNVIAPPEFKDDTFTRILCYILDRIDADDCWGSTDFENWAPVITALSAGLLLQCGFSLDTNWVAGATTPPTYANLLRVLSFLDSRIRDDGSFGEDIWDAARLSELIHKYDLGEHFERVSALDQYISRYIESRSYRQLNKTWDGPGCIAALLRVCEIRGNEQEANQLFGELERLQLASGEFHGPIAEDGNDLSSPVWHTAQALIAYLDRGISQKDPRVTRIVEWLIRTQAPEGAWRFFHRYDVYFTAYGVMALSRLSNPPEALSKAISWLESRVAPSGKVEDAGGTLMAALALGTVRGFRFEGALKGADYHNARKLAVLCSSVQADFRRVTDELEKRGTEVFNLKNQLQIWDKKFGTADFGISKKAAFILTLAVALALAGGVLGTSRILDYFFNCPVCQTKPSSTGALPAASPPVPELGGANEHSR